MTKLEQETIINYNEAEETASVYTHNKKLIRFLRNLAENSAVITVKKQNETCGEYLIPKKLVCIKKPRQLSEQQREKLRLQAKRNFRDEPQEEKG